MAKGKNLRKALNTDNIEPMTDIPTAGARPGAWKEMLLPAPKEGEENKARHVPVVIDDKIIEGKANGASNSELESQYELRDGYVRDTLKRRFGGSENMKRALRDQCYENAIALNTYAMANLSRIAPGQALVGAKIMIDGGLALERAAIDRPAVVDFAALAALGATLERVEKIVTGTDRTV